MLASAANHAREESRSALSVKLKPVTAGASGCIERGAGMDFDPPACDDGLWPLFVFYLLVYAGYAIGWGIVKLGELIYEACTEEDEATEEQTTEECAGDEDCAGQD
jgi:hypothetical protein